MVDDETYEDIDGPHDEASEQNVSPTPVDEGVKGFKESVDDALDPVSARTKEKLAELDRRTESGEISPDRYDINELSYLIDDDLPLRKKDLGNRALVLTADILDGIFAIDVITKTGKRVKYDTTGQDILILYPDDLGNKEFEPVKDPSLEECLERLPDDFTSQLDLLLHEIFSDVEFDAVLERNDAWDAIADTEPKFDRLLSKAREAGISEDYRKRFVCVRLREEIDVGQYAAAAAKLTIADMGTPDQRAAFASLAAEMQSELEWARKKEIYVSEARVVVQTLFADVAEGSRESFVSEAPEFWSRITPRTKMLPADRIREGRKSRVPEKHLRRFAWEILQEQLMTPADAWIGHFLTEMGYATPEATAFFQERNIVIR